LLGVRFTRKEARYVPNTPSTMFSSLRLRTGILGIGYGLIVLKTNKKQKEIGKKRTE
jgi:hypothetical protein